MFLLFELVFVAVQHKLVIYLFYHNFGSFNKSKKPKSKKI